MIQDLRLLGQARFGVYRDDCEGIHPDVIDKYYGTEGKTVRRKWQSGAGHPIDEEGDPKSGMDSDCSSPPPPLAERIAQDQRSHIRHEGIDVPLHGNPFVDNSAGEDNFWRVLAEVVQENIIPEGVGLHQDEWEDETYPLYEVLRIGNKGMREIKISLEDPI